MSITYYTGIPRSGKTLKAVALIYDTFVLPNLPKTNFIDKTIDKIGLAKNKKIEYLNCYTNINQFNYDIDSRLFKLDFDDLLKHLQVLYIMYLSKKPDDELIEKAKEFNIYKSLFVIDEAHNFFNKKSDLLTWWLSYHGHIHHDIILITQHLTLILKEYTQFTEYFYRAVPQRFRFSKNTFKYIEYSGRELYKTQKLGIISLKLKPQYFDLYVSGATKNDKPIIYKYIFILIFLFILVFIAIYRFSNSLEETKNPELEKNIPLTSSSLDSVNSSNNTDLNIIPGAAPSQNLKDEDLKLFKFTCFEKFCHYRLEDNTNFEIPLKILTQYLKDIEEDNKYLEINNSRVSIYVLTPKTKFNFINQQKAKNENNNANDQNFSLLSSSN